MTLFGADGSYQAHELSDVEIGAKSADLHEVDRAIRQELSDGSARVEVSMTAPAVVAKTPDRKKLTARQVLQIRALGALKGLADQRAIAAHFDLSQATVCNILNHKLWKVVDAADFEVVAEVIVLEMRAALDEVERAGGWLLLPGRPWLQLAPAAAASPASLSEGDAEAADATPQAGAAE